MFKLTTFKGEAPKIDANLIGNEQATLALDVDFTKELLAPVNVNAVTANSVSASTISIFPYSSNQMMSWETDVNVVRSQIAQDDWDRLYITGDGKPKVLSNDSYPVTYDLGVPAPSAAITIGTIGEDLRGNDAPDLEDATDDTTRFYIETFVTRFGEESSNNPVSTEVNLDHIYKTVDLTLNTLPVNTSNVATRRIYRSATTDATSGYFLVAELPLSTTTFTDNLLDFELGPEFTTSNHDVPPVNLSGIVSHPSGFVVGFVENELYMSEPYLPYAYPTTNRHSLDDDIVACAVSSDVIIVGTTGAPYAIVGSQPDATSAMRLELQEPCVSKRSMVDMGKYVIYASNNGLVAVSTTNATLITETLLDRREWAQFKPDTIRAFLFDNRYIAFYDGGGFEFDPESGNFSRLTGDIKGGYYELETGELFLINFMGIELFRADSALTPFTWKSKEFSVPDGSYFTAMWIECDDIAQVGLTCWVDEQQVFSVDIGQLTNHKFRVPPMRGNIVQFEITASTSVRRITFGESMGELR